MTNMHSAIPEEKLTEAYRLLLEMRDNCVKHADDQYDDPKREAKYEALNIAMAAMGRSIPPRWISVNERLPKRYEDVLVSTRFTDEGEPYVEIAYFAFDRWRKPEGMLYGKVTHWMPLPEPPEIKKE